MRKTIVLGAGLQGVLAALALARAGHQVTLIEGEDACMTRASLRNEGKIHLGFVYANDSSCRSSSLMLNAAMEFGPIVDDLVGQPVPWKSMAGLPFTYLVLGDSLVSANRLMEAWTRLDAKYRAERSAGRAYLGLESDCILSPPSAASRRFVEGERVVCAVDTLERALDMVRFRAYIAGALERSPCVVRLFGHRVREVRRTSEGFIVEGTTGEGRWRAEAETVVNCLWEGRLEIDRQLDLVPTRPWVYRLKYRLLGQLPPELADLPSLTLMLGKYGDVVNFGEGRVYLSWYPACLRGWSRDVAVPADWDRACRGDISHEERCAIVRDSLAAFDAIVPGFRNSRVDSVAAGVIFSWGETDIDDPTSELHRRDEIGPSAHDGYITVNTGKLTTAPLFARGVVDLLA